VRARLEWDVNADVDAILDDFFTKWFGPAAAPMQAYYDALEKAFEDSPVHGHEDVILTSIYTDELMATLARYITAAESAASDENIKRRLALERAMYEHLVGFVAMEKAKAAGEFAAAARHADALAKSQDRMNKLTPFMGWHPYKVYECEWERKRMEKLAALTDGPAGKLLVMLPEKVAFRTDPFDDGRFERWQSPEGDLSSWSTLLTTRGWDAQGLVDKAGHPYKGIAWYAFDVDVPASATGQTVFLHMPAVVNETWLWVNDRYAGHRDYMMPWFRPQPAEFEITRLLKPGTRNRLALRVLCNFDTWGANGIYERMFLYTKTAESAKK
jgi:hypothetical protein